MKKMEKTLKVVFVMLMVFVLSGCTKINAVMEIQPNGVISYSSLLAFNEEVVGDNEILSADKISALNQAGITVTNYNDKGMKGVNLAIKDLKIRDVSSDKETDNYDLSAVINNYEEAKLFKVKKGFFKNTYSAKFDLGDYSLDDLSNLANYLNATEDEESAELLEKLEKYKGTEEVTFTVKLPYKAISNNATDSKNDGKELSWNLLKADEFGTINFEFSLYNITNIFMIVLLAIVVIVVVVFIIMKKNYNVTKNNVHSKK